MSLVRVPTGIPGLDEVLGGGLLPGALMFVAGMPGAGKTVLALQMAFASARRGTPAVYFTTFSEPHDKLVRHVQGFPFYSADLLGEGVQLLNLEQALRRGSEETADAIIQAARAQHAGLVVLDGLRGVADILGGNETRVRELLYQLSAQLGVLGVCGVITFEIDPAEATAADFVTADVVLTLRHMPGRGRGRALEVLKARGSEPLAGAHSLYITDQGVVVYPQAEVVRARLAEGVPRRRAPFGIAALDALMGGGPTAGTSTLVVGAPGTGKTLLALQWLLAGAAAGERGLLLGFHESAGQLMDHTEALGLDLRARVADGSIDLWTQPAVALEGNRLAGELRARLAARHARRLVIDSSAELESSVAPERAAMYLSALIAYLRGEGITTLLTREVSGKISLELDLTGTAAVVLAENLILLRQVFNTSGVQRTLAILEMRYTAFTPGLYTYTIGAGGLRVGGPASGVAPVAGLEGNGGTP
jgi:circadian clock protein KaiC